MKIHVVEDELIEMKLADHVLRAAGHEVVRAGTAVQALAAVSEEHPDVIFLDLSLPGMDGLALVRRFKADAATRAIPLVAVTSHREKFPMAEALAAGCAAYLEKPWSTRKLPELLAQVAGRAREGPDR